MASNSSSAIRTGAPTPGAQAVTSQLISEKPAVHRRASVLTIQAYSQSLLQRAADRRHSTSSRINLKKLRLPTATGFVGAELVSRSPTSERRSRSPNYAASVAASRGKIADRCRAPCPPNRHRTTRHARAIQDTMLAKHPDLKLVSSPGGRLGRSQGQGDHADGLEAEPRSLWNRWFLGRHGHRHGGRRSRKQASQARCSYATSGGGERKGACELVKTGGSRSRHELRRSDTGRPDGGYDQVADLVRRETRFDQGVVLHDADPDHQSQRRQRYRVLESQRSEEIALSSAQLSGARGDRRAPVQPSRPVFG